MYYHSHTVALPIRIMDISCSSKSILWQSAICVAVLTMLYVVALSDEDVCTVPDSTCNCSSPLTSRPPRPSFAECSVGELPEHLTSLINVTCETNANVSCNTVCMFKCDAGYTITHNESIICKIGRFTPDIPSCNETNECDSNPCQNNGTCNDLIDDYNCTCVPGYEGKNCENPIVCTVPMDVTNYTTCNGSVLPLTICDFKCNETGNASVLVTCNATGSWSEVLPTCGSLGLNATTMNMTMNMTRRETLPLDNQDVLTVQKTFESAILGIPTTYLVIVTTINAQSLSNGEMQMNLLIGVMYTSDVTVESLIEQIEEALLAVDEFSVVSVDVTVTVPSTGTSASNPPTESTSSPSSTPSSTVTATVSSTGTSTSNTSTESMSSPSSTPSPTEPATVSSTGTSTSNTPTESMSSPSSTPSPTEPVTVPSTATSTSNTPTESISTSSLSLNPSPTVPVTVASTGTPASNPQTESMSSPSSTLLSTVTVLVCEATTMDPGRKRRETLPLDNQDVLTVQDTFESAILRIPTTYLVNVTTISAQRLSNGQIQMNLLIGVTYTSDVTVESLIEQIEEALLAVDEFSVVSVDVTDLDALCSPTPCKNNGECQVDYNTFDFTCVCASGYSGPQCSNSPNDVLLAILVPIAILILLVIIFFVVLVVYYRVRLHKLDGYKKRPFHYDVKARRYEDGMQLYFTEDRRYQHQDPVTFKNSAMGLRFSKEINARMQVRSQQMELHGHLPSASHHDPTGRHRSRTDPIQGGRSIHDRPVTGDQGFQGHRPNGMRSRGNPSLGHETGNGSVVYNEAARRSVNDRNMVFVGRSRNGSMPSDVHVANGFNDTRL